MMLGRAVEHQFEMDDGSKNGWKGLVLASAPIMPTSFFIMYEKDPVLYIYQLLEDYKQGDLQILPDTGECVLCDTHVKWSVVVYFNDLAKIKSACI